MKPLVYGAKDRVAYVVLAVFFAACIAMRIVF